MENKFQIKVMKGILLVIFCGVFATARAAVTPWIDFKLERGHIHIPVEIMGHKGTALLDSGASINGLSQDIIERFGEHFRKDSKIRIRGVYGTEKKQLYSKVPVRMFGTEFKLDKCVEGNFGKADLLLGLSFFRAFIVQIDYPHSKLRMITRKSLDMKKFANVPMKKASGSGLPLVRVSLNGSGNTWLTLDTGNAGGIFLNRKEASRKGLLKTAKGKMKLAFGAGMNDAVAMNQLYTIKSVKIGPYELENVKGVSALAGQKNNMKRSSSGNRLASHSGHSSVGLLGFDVLKHFIVTIDYSKAKLNLSVPND